MTPIVVVDEGTSLAFSFEDMLRYSGPGSPAGVALAYMAMRCAFPLLGPRGALERRKITTETPFRGPGARDGFELVTRGPTEGRYVADSAFERPERGTLAAFVFKLCYGDRAATLMVREGVVTDEFVFLARQEDRSPEDEARLTELKREHADRLLASAPAEVFDVESHAPHE
ncbi:MAG TPA: hypothetical protein VG184_08870 [Acidimicrobiales bacterium]|jgi:hypothetical protein|nr:hypothetical protein [Acidimicrobiales bacterium]